MFSSDKLRSYFKASLPIAALSSPSPEEMPAIEAIAQIALSIGAETYVFDTVSNFQKVAFDDGGMIYEAPPFSFEPRHDSISEAIEFIRSFGENGVCKAVFVLCDIHKFIDENDQGRFDCSLVRRIKTLAFNLKHSHKRVVLLGQDINLPHDLQGIVQEVNNPLPNASEIEIAIDEAIAYLVEYSPIEWENKLTDELKAKLVRSTQGLTLTEIADILRLATVADLEIGEKTIKQMTSAKMDRLKRLNVDFVEPPKVPVGGLDLLKKWVATRTKRFHQTEENSRPAPKGMMLVGASGTGKSMIAKAIGQLWGIPILSVDFGAVYSSLVGSSESNLRKLLQVSEAIAPCVLLIDEVEKVMGGMQGANDSGVSQRLLGKLLTWMNDKKAPVFVVCTANDISALPPEFTRKGRFDEIFFVDLPNKTARQEIITAHANKYADIQTEIEPEQLNLLAESMADFSGAEIASVIDDAISAIDDREDNDTTLRYADIAAALHGTKPLALSNPEMINRLREWAATSAKPANSPETEDTTKAKAKGRTSKNTIQMMP